MSLIFPDKKKQIIDKAGLNKPEPSSPTPGPSHDYGINPPSSSSSGSGSSSSSSGSGSSSSGSSSGGSRGVFDMIGDATQNNPELSNAASSLENTVTGKQVEQRTVSNLSDRVVDEPISLRSGQRVDVTWEQGGKTTTTSVEVSRLSGFEDRSGGRIINISSGGHVFYNVPSFGEYESEYRRQLVSEYNRSGFIPRSISSQITVPDIVKELNLEKGYTQSIFEDYLGIKSEVIPLPKGVSGPPSIKLRGGAAFEKSFYNATVGNIDWVREKGVFKTDSGDSKTFKQLKTEYGPALTLKYESGKGYVPKLDIEKGYQEMYKDTGVLGKVKQFSFGTLEFFDLDMWAKVATGDNALGYMHEKEYYATQNIKHGKGLETWATLQAPAYENVIIPIAGGAAFGAALGTVGKIGSGAIKVTGIGSKIVPKFASVFSKAFPVVAGGTFAAVEGYDIGTSFAESKTKGVSSVLKYSSRLGLGMFGAKAGLNKISKVYPDKKVPTKTYIFETDKGTKYVSIRQDFKGYSYGDIKPVKSNTLFKSAGVGKKGGMIYDFSNNSGYKSVVSGKTVYQKSFLGKSSWKTKSFIGEVSSSEVKYGNLLADIVSFESTGKYNIFSSKKTSPSLYNKLFNKFMTKSYSFSKSMGGSTTSPGKYGFKSFDIPKVSYGKTFGKVNNMSIFEDTSLTMRVTPKSSSGIDTFGGSLISSYTPTSSVFLPGSTFTGSVSKMSFPNVYFPRMDVGTRTSLRYKTRYDDSNIISGHWSDVSPKINQDNISLVGTSNISSVLPGTKLKPLVETKQPNKSFVSTSRVSIPSSDSLSNISIKPVSSSISISGVKLSTITSPIVGQISLSPASFQQVGISSSLFYYSDEPKNINKLLKGSKAFGLKYRFRKFSIPKLGGVKL